MTRSVTKVRDPELLALVQARLAELDSMCPRREHTNDRRPAGSN